MFQAVSPVPCEVFSGDLVRFTGPYTSRVSQGFSGPFAGIAASTLTCGDVCGGGNLLPCSSSSVLAWNMTSKSHWIDSNPFLPWFKEWQCRGTHVLFENKRGPHEPWHLAPLLKTRISNDIWQVMKWITITVEPNIQVWAWNVIWTMILNLLLLIFRSLGNMFLWRDGFTPVCDWFGGCTPD